MPDPIRFRETFTLLSPHAPVSYDVYTLHGALMAVVLPTREHARAGQGHIVAAAVEPLPALRKARERY
jgi:hypothetical protein